MPVSAIQLAEAISERRGRMLVLPEVDFVRISAGEIRDAALSVLPRVDEPIELQGGFSNGDRLELTFCRQSVGRGRDLVWRVIASDKELSVVLESGTFDLRVGQYLKALLASRFSDVAAAITSAAHKLSGLEVRFDGVRVPLDALAGAAISATAQFNILPATVSVAVFLNPRASEIRNVCEWVAVNILALRPIYELLVPSLRLFVPGMTEEEEFGFEEGAINFGLHRIRERDPQVIREAKAAFRKRNGGRLFCEICGFDFEVTYGERGLDYAEGHHTIPVATMRPGDLTKVADICIVCSNCHRMCHRSPFASPSALRMEIEFARLRRES